MCNNGSHLSVCRRPRLLSTFPQRTDQWKCLKARVGGAQAWRRFNVCKSGLSYQHQHHITPIFLSPPHRATPLPRRTQEFHTNLISSSWHLDFLTLSLSVGTFFVLYGPKVYFGPWLFLLRYTVGSLELPVWSSLGFTLTSLNFKSHYYAEGWGEPIICNCFKLLDYTKHAS